MAMVSWPLPPQLLGAPGALLIKLQRGGRLLDLFPWL